MAKYSEFRGFMFGNGVSEDYLRCCDYVNCVDSMGGFLFYAGISTNSGRSFSDFYNGWIKDRYYEDNYFRNLVGKMVYEEGYRGRRNGNYFRSCCKYFVEELERWFVEFRKLWWEEEGYDKSEYVM